LLHSRNNTEEESDCLSFAAWIVIRVNEDAP
jgi:hypothetical protein